jgi:DNA polymerase-3 subunit alpha
MYLFSFAEENISTDGYKYPEIPEYPLNTLLSFEKEGAGIYFSGHLADNYSKHIESLAPDRISDIASCAEEDNGESKYKDKQNVKIAGIITAKKTKVIKNGDTMAFITVEDRFSEIEVVVFARQYAKYSDEIFLDNAVSIQGSISIEEGEKPKILLSSLDSLLPNSDFRIETKQPIPQRLFIKVDSLNDRRLATLSRMSYLHSGNIQVVIFDNSTRKYQVLKDVTLNGSDEVILRLESLFGKENLVLK